MGALTLALLSEAMAGGTRRIRRSLRTATAALIAAAACTVAAAGAAAAPADTPAAAKGPSWSVGDCFEKGDIEARSVDLTSDVGCDEEHVAQIVAGSTLPAGLRGLSRSELIASGPKLAAFIDKTCASTPVLRNLYPKKTAKALGSLVADHGVTQLEQWTVPAAGRFDIVLPDETSYGAGTHAVLCVFVPDKSFTGSSAGDIRDVATGDPLDALRICFPAAGRDATNRVPCTEDHGAEDLLRMQLSVGRLPDSVDDWTDADWADFDDVCADVGELVVGANRDDLQYGARTNAEIPAVDGTRWIVCAAAPTADGARLPGGLSVARIGRQDIAFAGA